MSWRQASPAPRTQRAQRTRRTAAPFVSFVRFVSLVLMVLIANGRDLPRAERFEKSTRGVDVELRILRLDAQKKTVAARQREPRHVEYRVVRHRQAVEREHAEHREQRRAENR